MNFFKKRLNKKGFTLVELLIVIAVLGIIAGIGITSMNGVTDNVKTKADEATADMIAKAIEVEIISGGVATEDLATADKLKAETEIAAILASSEAQAGTGGQFTISSWDKDTGDIKITGGGKDYPFKINYKPIN